MAATILYGNLPVEVDFNTYESYIALQEVYHQIDVHARAITTYAEAFGVSLSSIIGMGFTFLSKFISSFYGIIISIIGTIIGLLLKRKYGKTTSSIGGGGGGGGGGSTNTFSNITMQVADDTSKLGQPSIDVNEIQKVDNKKREAIRQKLASHKEYDPLKANDTAVKMLSHLLTNEDVGNILTQELPVILQKIDRNKLASLVRVGIDSHNPGLIHIDDVADPTLALIMLRTDMYDSAYMPDILGKGGTMYLVDESEVRRYFEDIAKITNVPNTELDISKMICSYLESFTDIFIVSVVIILKTAASSIQDEATKNFIDSQISSVLNEALVQKLKVSQVPFDDKYKNGISKDDINSMYSDLIKSTKNDYKILNPKDLDKVQTALDNVLKKGIIKIRNVKDIDMELVCVGKETYDIRVFKRDKREDTIRSKFIGAHLARSLEDAGINSQLKTEYRSKVKELTDAIDSSKNKIIENMNNLQGNNVDSMNYALEISRTNTQILSNMLELTSYLVGASNHTIYSTLASALSNHILNIATATMNYDELMQQK